MYKNINCIHNDGGAYCKHKCVKRSLFGFGARCCVKFYGKADCEFQEKLQRPEAPPPKPQPAPIRILKDMHC